MIAVDLTRREGERWHFVCTGELILLFAVPRSVVRVGDTAAGTYAGYPLLWRCTDVVLEGPRARSVWEATGEWSLAASAAASEGATNSVLVTASRETMAQLEERGTPVLLAQAHTHAKA